MCYKLKSKEPTDEEHKWYQGMFLGICLSAGQYILHCVERNTIKMARTIRALPDQVKWNAESIEAVRVSPFYCHKSAGHGVTHHDRPARDGDTDQLRKRPNGRKIYIKGEDLRVYGCTDSCPRCDHERRYGPGRTTKGHSDACRFRIVSELANKNQRASAVVRQQTSA